MNRALNTDSDGRKRIWKRLRFWGGMVLVVVVGTGVLFWHTYRKSLGPPPTPPGKSPEFDQHLAEIDDKWLFVFNYDGKYILTDIHGRDVAVLLDIHKIRGQDCGLNTFDVSVSPDKRTAVIAYRAATDHAVMPPCPELAFIDLRDYSVSRLALVEIRHHIFIAPIRWLDGNTILSLLLGPGFQRGVSPMPWRIPQCIRVDIRDSAKLELFNLPFEVTVDPELSLPVFDGEARVLLFHRATFDTVDGKLMAYDLDGLRLATAEEEEKYDDLVQHERDLSDAKARGRPRIDVVESGKNNWLRKILVRYFGHKSKVKELRMEGKLVRLSRVSEHGLGLRIPPRWNEELDLLSWVEGDLPIDFRTHLADRDGRYRFWHKGWYWGKVPRWKGESEEAGE